MRELTFMMPDNGKLPEVIKMALVGDLPKLASKKVKFSYGESKDKRSLNQNAYWFKMLDKYVVPAFREAGSNWSNYKLHCCLMQDLGYEEALVAPNGKIVASRLHSRDFTTTAWEEYMERARAHLATEYRIFVPLPNEQERKEFGI